MSSSTDLLSDTLLAEIRLKAADYVAEKSGKNFSGMMLGRGSTQSHQLRRILKLPFHCYTAMLLLIRTGNGSLKSWMTQFV